ncbi:zinc finger protein basonuclin-2-like isoform X2 [Neocloeon triangulifer]|uniref:zinc finger protein basonuclin-2-like isoform X2 n=1 Tax=Neocloeon triangulifer TaxID=2078957 RepID=UPI00286F9F71|nr:zinc finger protein basonuclin-2-like isoform X2 [Neocloeon triangulifer]
MGSRIKTMDSKSEIATPDQRPNPSEIMCPRECDAAAGNPERVRMTQLDSKMASPDLMMEVWASVASWFLRPPAGRPANGQASPLNTAIRCTVPGCVCDCFVPGKLQLRQCESCRHGWVTHALDKLGPGHLGPVEPVSASVAFDVASLVLYGCQALPIRLKILLDRVFSVLQRDEVLQVLHGFGWSHDDYSRGYILQDPQGGVLERWHMCGREEEPLVLQQFLRFGETRAITQQLLALDAPPPLPPPALRPHASDIKRFIAQTPAPNKKSTSSRDPLAFLKAAAPPTAAPPTPTASPASSVPSPLSVSPLNRLQSMQPLDFRKSCSPERRVIPPSANRRPSEEAALPATLPFPLSGVGKIDLKQHDFSASDSEDENSALNLSRDGAGSASSRAIKRQWSPLGATLVNPATGKKRVQCSVCMKTFCDKGALKIHFSAVHLREMHKCTVDGCSMMFSSRRSRNRHSANPNPKLHSPHLRRKISPHDGRSSHPHHLLLPPPPLLGLAFPPGPQFSAGPRLDFSSGGSISSEEATLGDSDSVEAPAKARKRKNQHPTRITAPSSDDDDCGVNMSGVGEDSSAGDDEDINRNSTDGSKCKEESSVALHSLRQLENLSSNLAG